ncbi:MAG TPA: response regulator [bacterium]|nr:response regulator [bacterium]
MAERSSKKVLVVDDDEDIVNIVSSLLEHEGYETVTALNGKEALERALVEKPDLIIADIMMPEMDGWEFCWRVRENATLGETPFVFLTARADVMDQIRGSEIGADDYIIKPFRKQELLKRVQNTFDVIELLRKVKTQPSGTEAAFEKKPAAKAKKPAAKKPAGKPTKKAAKKGSKPAAKSGKKKSAAKK